MTRLLSCTGALALVFVAQASLAADMPITKAPAAVVAAPFNWTGPYAGLHVGYGRGEADWSVTLDGFGFLDPPGIPVDIKGWLGGAQAGYNWQVGSWVHGVEVDFSGARIKGFDHPGSDDGYFAKVDWFGTLRGRTGPVFDRLLFYLTGGLAYGHIKGTTGDTAGAGGPFTFDSTSDTGVSWGWTLGGGVEWAFMPNWSLRAEALYVDLGTFKFRGQDPLGGIGNDGPVRADIDTRFTVVRGAINYRFATGKYPVAPVVTKY